MELYDLQHILYIVISVVLTVAVLVLIKKFCKTDKSVKIAILAVAGVLLAVFVWNRISLAVIEGDALKLMPYSFCSMTTLLLALCTLFVKNKNHPVFHCIVYMAIIGPVLTLIFPSFIIGLDPIRTYSGMLHHSVALLLAILLIMYRQFRPDWKKWWALALGLCAYVTFGLFQIRALGFSDSMEINRAFVDGTFLWWYVVGPMVVVGVTAIVFTYQLIEKKIIAKKAKLKTEEIQDKKP
ncbi:MAG: YwaF family protein [Firmicutes bacterium]|nr:YwaF family protein [Bacillota bacterium]